MDLPYHTGERFETTAPVNCMGSILLLSCMKWDVGTLLLPYFCRKMALLLLPPAVLLEEMLNYLAKTRITGCESWSGRLTCLQPENRWLSSSEGYNLRSNLFLGISCWLPWNPPGHDAGCCGMPLSPLALHRDLIPEVYKPRRDRRLNLAAPASLYRVTKPGTLVPEVCPDS